MDNVFEPMNFAGDVFEPMANFGGKNKSKEERLLDGAEKLKNILKTKNISNSQKKRIANAVATGGVFAGLYLASRFIANKKRRKSRFDANENFAGEVFEPMNFAGEVFEPMNFAGDVFEPMANFGGDVFEPMNFAGKKKVKPVKPNVKKPVDKPVDKPADKPVDKPVEEPKKEDTISAETPADDVPMTNKKIFGMPKKVVIGVGVGIVVVGVASFFLLRKKK